MSKLSVERPLRTSANSDWSQPKHILSACVKGSEMLTLNLFICSLFCLLSFASNVYEIQRLFGLVVKRLPMSTVFSSDQTNISRFHSLFQQNYHHQLGRNHKLKIVKCSIPDMSRMLLTVPEFDEIQETTGLEEPWLLISEIRNFGKAVFQPADGSDPIILTKVYKMETNDTTTLGYMSKHLLNGSDEDRIDAYSYIFQGVHEALGNDILGKTRQEIKDDYKMIDDEYESGDRQFGTLAEYKRYRLGELGYRRFCVFREDDAEVEVVHNAPTDFADMPFFLNLFAAWKDTLKSMFPNIVVHDNYLRIIFGFGSQEKIFPTADDPVFRFAAVNSAFAMEKRLGIAASDVMFLYRQEELVKVFLHELVHILLGTKQTHHRSSILGRSNTLETFVETVAVVANCSLQSGLPEGTSFEECISMERKFSLLQSAKIVLIAGYNSFENFLANIKSDELVKGGPSTVEYHVYKCALLRDLESFFDITTEHLDASDHLDPFILKSIRSPEFVTDMSMAMGVVREMQKNDSVYGPLLKTGRMTIVEVPFSKG